MILCYALTVQFAILCMYVCMYAHVPLYMVILVYVHTGSFEMAVGNCVL